MKFSFFSKTKEAFGLEISDFSLKALYLKKKGKKYSIVGLNRIKLPKGLIKDGKIDKKEEMKSLLKHLLDTATPKKIPISRVITSLPENQTFVRMIDIPTMTNKDLKEAIKWEAANHIPLQIKDVYLDWQILSKDKKNMKVLIGAASKNVVNSYVSILEEAKLKPIAIEPGVASRARSLLSEQDTKETFLLVDIGATRTVFNIVKQNIVYYSSSLFEVSGNMFTKTIAKSLNLKESESEHIKVTCCSPKITEKERKLLIAVHPSFDILAAEIIKIKKYFYDRIGKPNEKLRVLLCGGGSGLFGIVPYLSLKTKYKIEIGNPWLNIDLSSEFKLSNDELLAFTDVIGLALRGTNLEKYQNYDYTKSASKKV